MGLASKLPKFLTKGKKSSGARAESDAPPREISGPTESIREETEVKKEKPDEAKSAQEEPAQEKNQPKDEDEINIDLKKVKGFFSKIGSDEEKAEDEPISFDVKSAWSKVKSIGKSAKAHDSDEEDINIGIGKAWSFISRNRTYLLILAVVLLTIYVRMIPADMPFAENAARNTVVNNLRSNIESQVRAQNPGLPDAQVRQVVTDQYNIIMKQQGQQVEEQIQAFSNQIKDFFRDATGRPYLPDIDTYYWLRYTENIIEHGYPGDVIKDGQQWDDHQLAPFGRAIPQSDLFHPYFLGYLYRLANLLNSNISISQAMAYYPVVISALTTVLVFLIARKVGGDVAGLIAGIMAALNGSLVTRTIFGHADSDAWVVLIPVLIIYLYLEAFDARNRYVSWGLVGLSGLTVGVFSFAWGGWWYIFDFIVGMMVIYFLYFLVTQWRILAKQPVKLIRLERTRHIILMTLGFIVSSGIFVTLLTNFRNFSQAFLVPFAFRAIKTPVEAVLWPNVLTTVAELNEGSFNQIISQIGGKFIFMIALIGILVALTRRDKDNHVDPKYAIILSIWLVGTIYASTKGIRFTLLIAPAIAVAYGAAFGIGHRHISRWVAREFNVKKWLISLVIIVFALWLFSMPVASGQRLFQYRELIPGIEGSYLGRSIGEQDAPIVNDAWVNSLAAIKNNDTSGQGIISSWWDFGHHFKQIADTRVTFDGTTQNTAQAHWIGKVLMTSDEREAVGIMRMLNCGGNEAQNVLQRLYNPGPIDPAADATFMHDSIGMIKRIIMLDREEARKALLSDERINESTAEEVLNLTHCEPPDSYFIASWDMIGKAGVWAHFGSWDFQRADIWRYLKNEPETTAVQYMVENFNMSASTARDLYFQARSIRDDNQANAWVAPWPSYSGGPSGCSERSDLLTCQSGLQVNTTSWEAFFLTPQGIAMPKVLAVMDRTGVTVHEFSGSSVQDVGVTLLYDGNSYSALLSHPNLAGGIFTRMYFMRGHGLKYFDLIDTETNIFGGGEIFVYKIDWGGRDTYLRPEVVEPVVKAGSEVAVDYIGYFSNNTVFDSSIRNWQLKNVTWESALEDSSPLRFKIGQGQVIQGFEEGLLGLKESNEKTIEVPPEKGYGMDVSSHPLANKTLFFRVRVASIS